MAELPVRYHCRHVHLSGHRCGSPALRGEPFCYFHHTTRRPPARLSPDSTPTFQIPPLEDRATLQLAIADVLTRIAAGTLDPKRAGLLLYGLQIAQNNLPPHRATPAPADTVAEVEHDEANQPLAPEQPFAEAAHEKTLEEILMQQWEEDKAIEAEDREAQQQRNRDEAAELLKLPQLTATPEPAESIRYRYPFEVPTLQAVAAPCPSFVRLVRARTSSRGQKSRRRKAPAGSQGRCGCYLDYAGDHLISHTLTRAVPSAQRGLTSVFGMGTGVTLAVNSPAKFRTVRRLALAVVHN